MNLEDVKRPRLYSTPEIAAFMEIGYWTLLRMVRLGRIKAINVAASGKKPIYRFRAEDVQEHYDSLPHTNLRLEDVHK